MASIDDLIKFMCSGEVPIYFERLFDARNGKVPSFPTRAGLSYPIVIRQVGTSKPENLLQNQASDIDVQMVTFSVDTDQEEQPARAVTPVVVLSWGCGGTQHQAEINVKRGTIFSVGCSFYNVTGRLENATEDDIGTKVNFRASAAYGSHPGAREPTREFAGSFAIGAAGAFIDFAIPKFARIAALETNDPVLVDVAGNVTARFYGDLGDPIGQIMYTGTGLHNMTFGLDHQRVRVANTTASALQVMLQFELAF
jgi:hypothetical protein